MNRQKRGRPVLDERQKADREILKQKFLEHSAEALETIVNIMRKSMDSTSRLKASTFILNKVIPEAFIFESEIENNLTITLLPTGDVYQQSKDDEQEIWNVENGIDDDTSDAHDEWGEEIYTPKK